MIPCSPFLYLKGFKMPRNDDMSLILTKAKKAGFFQDVYDWEVDSLEKEASRLLDGDVHPKPEDLAVGDGTLHRREITTSAVPTVTQSLRLTYFTANRSETVSTVRYTVGSVSAGATPTLSRIGLYIENPDLSLTLVASTPNDTALFTGGTFAQFTKALSVPYAKIRGQRYALGVLIVTVAAVPNLYGQNSQGNILLLEPKLSAALAGQTDLPAAVTNASLASSGYIYYLEVF